MRQLQNLSRQRVTVNGINYASAITYHDGRYKTKGYYLTVTPYEEVPGKYSPVTVLMITKAKSKLLESCNKLSNKRLNNIQVTDEELIELINS